MQSLNADVPAGFFEMLVDFTISLLHEKPEDFNEFAAAYFQRVYESQGDNLIYVSFFQEHSESLIDSILESLDFIDEDALMVKPKADFRRKSVAAEKIDLDDFDDEEELYTIVPKSDEQRARLKNACEQILLFKCLDDEQVGHIIDAMFLVETNPGDNIIVQGDDGDNFYIIDSGIYNCYIKDGDADKLIHTYNNEGCFGELALLYNAPRSATVVAETKGILWAMDRKIFRVLVIVETFNRKQIYDNFLKEVPLFQEMTPGERMNVADALIPKKFEDKEVILKQGKPGKEMFFVESGEILITKNHNGNEVELTRLHKGQYFGELALLSNQARQASAYAVGQTRCAMLDVKTFERLMGPCLEIMKRNTDEYKTQLGNLFGADTN